MEVINNLRLLPNKRGLLRNKRGLLAGERPVLAKRGGDGGDVSLGDKKINPKSPCKMYK